MIKKEYSFCKQDINLIHSDYTLFVDLSAIYQKNC